MQARLECLYADLDGLAKEKEKERNVKMVQGIP